jgi:hypothetical protein
MPLQCLLIRRVICAALCTSLDWGCGGNVAGNGLTDASSGAGDTGSSLDAGQNLDEGALGDVHTGNDATQIDVSTLRGAVPACPVAYAHANVCCQSGPRQPTVCLESPTSPFQPCDQDAVTFPDPAKCCPINGNGPCESPLIEAIDGSAPGACSFPCAPVGYSPANVPSGSPLTSPFPSCSTASAGERCSYCCYGALGSPCLLNQCNCPATGPCQCGPQCGGCPAGWRAPAPGQVDLCCRTDTSGTQCFSQSDKINSPNSFGCFHGPNKCDCARSGSDGHSYEAWCDSASTPLCTCAIDGKTTRTTTSTDCSVLLDSVCGFPPVP